MSMQSWTVTGFGVKEKAFDKASIDDKIRFIKTYLPKVYEEMQADGEDDENTDGNYETLATSLNRFEFPASKLKELYVMRWSIMPISA